VFMLTILLLASVFAAYTVIERYLGSVTYAEAANDLAAGNIEGATAAINRSLVFTRSERAYQLATNAGITQMQIIATNTKLSPAETQQQFQTALSGSIAAAKEAVALDPNNYKNWMALGSVYQVVVPVKIEGAYQNAKDAYAQAARLNPSSPLISYQIAQLDLAHSDLPAAEKDLIQAISQKHDYARAIFLLSQVQVQEGKAKDALQTAEAAKYFAPNDPDVLFQVGILRSGTGDQVGAASALDSAVKINPQFANARFFLAVVYAGQGKLAEALTQMQAIAALSDANAKAVAQYIASLNAGKNPFPQTALGALGVPQPGVTDTATTTAKTGQVVK
jgi:cytochrome c-type biogenesis protein CcmH/NrfG